MTLKVDGVPKGELWKDGDEINIELTPAVYNVSASYKCSSVQNFLNNVKDYNMQSQRLDVDPGVEIEYLLSNLCMRNKTACGRNGNPITIPNITVRGGEEIKLTRLEFRGNEGHSVELFFEYFLNELTYKSQRIYYKDSNPTVFLRQQGKYKLHAKLEGKEMQEQSAIVEAGSNHVFIFEFPLIEVPNRIWMRFAQSEKSNIDKKNIVKIIKDDSYGLIIDYQGQNLSDTGSSMGSFLGAEYARRQYNDDYFKERQKNINQGKPLQSYNSVGAMNQELLGALIGSINDTPAQSKYAFRYTIRTGDGKLTYKDVVSSDPFRHSKGACVNIENMQPIMQEICEYDFNSYKKNVFDYPLQYSEETSKSSSLETRIAPARSTSDRLKDLKKLLDENLINREQHDYQVKRILDAH